MVNIGPPGEGLAYLLHERQVLGASKDPAPRSGIRVQNSLQIGEQVGRVLDFIQNCPARVIGQERLRVFVGPLPCRRVFKRNVCVVRKQAAAEGCFSTLSRPRKHHGSECVRGLAQVRRQISIDKHMVILHKMCKSEVINWIYTQLVPPTGHEGRSVIALPPANPGSCRCGWS